MSDQTQPPVEPGASQPLGQTPPPAQDPAGPTVEQPAQPGPYVDDLLRPRRPGWRPSRS